MWMDGRFDPLETAACRSRHACVSNAIGGLSNGTRVRIARSVAERHLQPIAYRARQECVFLRTARASCAIRRSLEFRRCAIRNNKGVDIWISPALYSMQHGGDARVMASDSRVLRRRLSMAGAGKRNAEVPVS